MHTVSIHLHISTSSKKLYYNEKFLIFTGIGVIVITMKILIPIGIGIWILKLSHPYIGLILGAEISVLALLVILVFRTDDTPAKQEVIIMLASLSTLRILSIIGVMKNL